MFNEVLCSHLLVSGGCIEYTHQESSVQSKPERDSSTNDWIAPRVGGWCSPSQSGLTGKWQVTKTCAASLRRQPAVSGWHKIASPNCSSLCLWNCVCYILIGSLEDVHDSPWHGRVFQSIPEWTCCQILFLICVIYLLFSYISYGKSGE